MRVLFTVVPQANPLQVDLGLFAKLGPDLAVMKGPHPACGHAELLGIQTEHDVFNHGQVRKERILLEDNPPVTIGPCDGLALQVDGPLRGLFRTEDQAQERGLATSARPDHGHKLTGTNREIDIVEHGTRLPVSITVTNINIFKVEEGHECPSTQR